MNNVYKEVLSKKKQALNIKHRTLFKDLLNKTKQKITKVSASYLHI